MFSNWTTVLLSHAGQNCRHEIPMLSGIRYLFSFLVTFAQLCNPLWCRPIKLYQFWLNTLVQIVYNYNIVYFVVIIKINLSYKVLNHRIWMQFLSHVYSCVSNLIKTVSLLAPSLADLHLVGRPREGPKLKVTSLGPLRSRTSFKFVLTMIVIVLRLENAWQVFRCIL